MEWPAFNDEGDLPVGLYRAGLREVLDHFGESSSRRQIIATRLERISDKEEPNDIDVIMIMEDSFDLASVSGETALVFQHSEADAHFGASVFWVRRSAALGGVQAMIEHWQVRREGGRRGIVEIVAEGS